MCVVHIMQGPVMTMTLKKINGYLWAVGCSGTVDVLSMAALRQMPGSWDVGKHARCPAICDTVRSWLAACDLASSITRDPVSSCASDLLGRVTRGWKQEGSFPLNTSCRLPLPGLAI
ncbi:hypothetical protein V2G26_004358 [Clonostachys chloroleuca]